MNQELAETIIEVDDLKFSLKKELQISSDLERDISRLPHLFGYVAIASERADGRLRRGRLAFDMWRSSYEDELCQDTKFSRVKDLTRLVMKHPKYKAWMLKLDEYEEKKGTLRQIARALEMKKDLVQTTAADRRKEHR